MALASFVVMSCSQSETWTETSPVLYYKGFIVGAIVRSPVRPVQAGIAVNVGLGAIRRL